jgi:hypothetical protein
LLRVVLLGWWCWGCLVCLFGWVVVVGGVFVRGCVCTRWGEVWVGSLCVVGGVRCPGGVSVPAVGGLLWCGVSWRVWLFVWGLWFLRLVVPVLLSGRPGIWLWGVWVIMIPVAVIRLRLCRRLSSMRRMAMFLSTLMLIALGMCRLLSRRGGFLSLSGVVCPFRESGGAGRGLSVVSLPVLSVFSVVFVLSG